MNDTPHATNLVDWEALYGDKAGLLKSPEAHQFTLDVLARELHVQGVIDARELADLIEQADAAYRWAVEEQLNAELNQPEVN